MVINNIKRAAELILLKDKNYEEVDKLRDYLKKYIDLCNEIGILEETLKDLGGCSRNIIIDDNGKPLNEELKNYLNILNELKLQLDNLNENKKIIVLNYKELNDLINKMKNIKIEIRAPLKWEICSKIENLKEKLEYVEHKLELIILNYGIKKFDINLDNIKNEKKELNTHIYERIIQHLSEDYIEDYNNIDKKHNKDEKS
ncbi:hypothetical protein KKP97_05470 [Methanothermococcus sp. SCGC AD-155-C09]|nr:hypothetical protein [Methanothermococcus sp. SCGC AD-155-C09]